jgi:magnesium transporter
MLKCYKTNIHTQKLDRIDEILPDSWIDLSQPTEEEISRVADIAHVNRELLAKMLDDDELPRIESEKNATLIVIDVPSFISQEDKYVTYPLGIIITSNNYFITIAPKGTTLLNDFRKNIVKNFRTAKKSRFLIQILNAAAASYIKVLDEIYREIEAREETLQKSTRNEDLISLLATEKTLVYFATSLKENDGVLDRLSKGSVIALFEGDADLLEDTIIETHQAIDMAGLYRRILSSITNTYATVISNNLNNVMKFLTGITIVLSIPTIISSFLGMNVWFGEIGTNHASAWVILGVSIVASLGVAAWLKKKGML